jgi:hypothetical protein
MTTTVYMTGRDQELRFEDTELAEKFLRSMGFVPRPQPRQWVARFDSGNMFAELVEDSYLDELLAKLDKRR